MTPTSPPPEKPARNFTYSLKAFWLYGPGVFTVLLSYYLLTNLTQGQDVLMLVGESWGSAIIAIIATSAWALIMWYSARMVGYEKNYEDDRWPKPVLSVFPRMLAYNALVSIQAAILALPTIGNLTLWWLLLFITLHNAYSFLLHYIFSKPKEARNKICVWIAIIFGLGYLIGLLLLLPKAASEHAQVLPWVACILFVLQILLLRWFIYRRAVIDDLERNTVYPDVPAYLRLFGLKLVRVPPWFIQHEIKTFRIFNGFAALALLLFALQLFLIPFAIWCGPLVVVLLAFALLTGGFNILSAISVRKHINMLFILLVWAWLVGHVSDPYQIHLTPRRANYHFSERPLVATYFKQWVQQRKEKITQGNYPVFIVLADGGASRSGYWVASVLNAWQALYPPGQSLTDHLFCLSGASGGSVGNAAFYAQLQTNSARGSAPQFLANDFLSFSIAHMLGTDPARHVLPFPFSDRAHAIALTMEELSQPSLGGAFAKNWEDIVDTSGQLPLLLINTTRVQGGRPAVISPVPLADFSKRLDVLSMLDTIQKSFSLATASVLGARFPYVSPAGGIGDHQFVDGGYFDNSGAGVVHEMLFYLESLRLAEKDSTLAHLYRQLRFHVVHITNSPLPDKDITAISPLANDLAAPLLTVFNTYATQTEVNDARLRNFLEKKGGTYTTINLYDSTSGDYPMNWVISSYRLQLMEKEVQRVKEKELKKLVEIKN
jgi:hypothetical protein